MDAILLELATSSDYSREKIEAREMKRNDGECCNIEEMAQDLKSPPVSLLRKFILPVDVMFYINKIGLINTANLTAEVDIGVCFVWRDPRVFNGRIADLEQLPEDLWGPSIVLWNAGQCEVIYKDFTIDNIEEQTLTRTMRFKAVLNLDHHVSFQNFPFDLFEVTLKFTCSSSGILLNEKKIDVPASKLPIYFLRMMKHKRYKPFNFWTFKGDLIDWQLQGIECDLPREYSFLDHPKIQKANLSFIYKRKPHPYMLRIVMPIFLLTCLTFNVFLFEDTPTSDKMSYVVTTLLAAFALLFVVNQDLPKGAGLSILDKMILFTLFILSSIGLIIMTIDFFGGEKENIREIRITTGVVFFCSYCILVATFLLRPWLFAANIIKSQHINSNFTPFSEDLIAI